MESGSNSLPRARSNNWVWILLLAIFLLCWPLICCCCLVLGAAGWFLEPDRSGIPPIPGVDDLPPVQTVPAIPLIPTRTPDPGSLPLLDPDAVPLFGSASLASGFTPDPYVVEAEAGGSVDTSGLDMACGYTSYHPAFVFDLEGGEAETFLRLFFTAGDGTAATLLVHTPDGEWLCEEDSPYGKDPVVDIELAPSGEYAIWVGTQQEDTTAAGSLSITGSMDVTP